jgi:hypothetical protein
MRARLPKRHQCGIHSRDQAREWNISDEDEMQAICSRDVAGMGSMGTETGKFDDGEPACDSLLSPLLCDRITAIGDRDAISDTTSQT